MPTPALRARSISSSSSPSPGCGASVRLAVAAAQQLQRAVHLGHRRAAQVGDAVGRRAHPLVARGGAERLRLHDDQADVVGDDVVQFLRDPHALLGDRTLREQLALAVQQLGALAQAVEARAAVAAVEADAGRDRAQQRQPDEVGGAEPRAAGEPVDEADGHDRAGRGDRRLAGMPRSDRVERDHQRDRDRPVDRDEDVGRGDDGEHDEGVLPPYQQHQHAGEREQCRLEQLVSRPGGLDHRGRHDQDEDDEHDQHVDRAGPGRAQPRRKGRRHARSVSPVPTST